MKKNTIKIALLQQESDNTRENNLKKALSWIKKAVAHDAKIVISTELFLHDYFCKKYDSSQFDLAESVPGPTTEAFQEVARQHKVVLTCSVFEKDGPLFYNTLAVIDADGSYLGKYRKMHIPDDPGFYEKYYFTPGDTGFKVFDTMYGRIGTLICWDQWFPEAARITAMQGADLLIYPTAIATLEHESGQDKQTFLNAWQTVQQSHAITNGCHVASVNRVGTEDGMKFWGSSFVAGPFGEMLTEGGNREQIVYADCNWEKNDEVRREWPFFRDRRVDAYSSLQKTWLSADE